MKSKQFISNPIFINGSLLFFLMLMTGSYALHLGQDANFDLRNYHWYNGFGFLYNRFELDIAVGSKPGYNNPILDALNYLIITLCLRAKIAEFALGTLHGISLFFLFKIALIFFKQYRYPWLLSFLAVLVGGTGVASLSQIGGTYNESQVSIFTMAALYCIIRAIDHANGKYWLYGLGGFILGFGIGAKLTAIPFGIGIILSLFCYKKWGHHLIKSTMITGCALLFGFVISDGYWMWKLYQHFQNPLFPYYNQIFHSSYAPLEDFKFKKWIPTHLWQGFLYPFYWLKKNMVTQDFPMKDPRIAITLILGSIYFFKIIYQRLSIAKITRFLLLFFVISYIIWMAEFSIYRYIIPLNYTSGILIVFFAGEIFTLTWLQLPIITMIAYFTLHNTYMPKWNRAPYSKYFYTIALPEQLPHHALVLVDWPTISYLATFLPKSNHYIGYYNLMMRPGNPNLYQLAIRKIHEFQGPLFMLFSATNIKLVKDHLAENSLILKQSACQTITSNLEKAPVYLCPITQTT